MSVPANYDAVAVAVAVAAAVAAAVRVWRTAPGGTAARWACRTTMKQNVAVNASLAAANVKMKCAGIGAIADHTLASRAISADP
jgi:hypothetical protein